MDSERWDESKEVMDMYLEEVRDPTQFETEPENELKEETNDESILKGWTMLIKILRNFCGEGCISCEHLRTLN